MRIILTLFLTIVIFNVCRSQEIENPLMRDEKIPNTMFYATAGIVLGADAENFFDIYQKELGGIKDRFRFTAIFGAGTKIQIFENIRLGLNAGFYEASINDGYTREVTVDEEKLTYVYDQKFKSRSIPLFISFDYLPFMTNQFRTFTGIGGGMEYNEITWNETLTSPDQFDIRDGGEHINDKYFWPYLRVFTGIELGFDKRNIHTILGSLVIELSYSHTFKQIKIFEDLQEEFREPPSSFFENYSLLNGYLSLNIGLSLNFSGKTITN